MDCYKKRPKCQILTLWPTLGCLNDHKNDCTKKLVFTDFIFENVVETFDSSVEMTLFGLFFC